MTAARTTHGGVPFAKAHAYGNDFLFVEAGALGTESREDAVVARAICDRHCGIGADGLIVGTASSRGQAVP